MRCSGVRAAVVAKIRSVVPDTKTSNRDVFKVLEVGYREIQGAQDRSVTVLLVVPPARANRHITQDSYTATFEITVGYPDYRNVADRIGDDGERISQALEALPGENQDILNVDLSGTGIEELEGYLNVTYSLIIDYKIDSGV